MECDIGDITVHFEDIGSGRPVIMLHGFSLDHRVMTGCMEPLFSERKGWRRIYLDLPGMGMTKPAHRVTNSDRMLEVVLEFTDAVIPDQVFVLAGESYGGYLALGAVHERPSSVKGLLLICPVIFADHSKRNVPSPTTMLDDEVLQLGQSKEDEMFRSIAVVRDRRHWERFHQDILPGTRLADGAFLEKLQSEGYPLSFDVTAISFDGPSLILLGRQDSVVGYLDARVLIEKFRRGTFAILDRAGHDLQIEQEALFNALVSEWLNRVERQDVLK